MMASYLYYQCDVSAIPDAEFDRICRNLAEGWDSFEHPHKQLASHDAMIAGTGYFLKYPDRVRLAAWEWLKTLEQPVCTPGTPTR